MTNVGEEATESGEPDPDAPWRRGFDGWQESPAAEPVAEMDPTPRRAPGKRNPSPGAVAPSAPRPSSAADDPPDPGGRGERRRVGPVVLAGALAVLVIVVAGVLYLRGDGDAARTSAAPALPLSIDRSWTLGFDVDVDDVAIAGDVVIVGADGGLTALGLADGSEVWSRPELLGGPDVEIEQIAVVGDRILVQMASVAGSDVRAFDRASGVELWVSDGGGGAYSILDSDDRPSVLRRIRQDGRSLGQLIDTSSGVPLGDPVALSSVSATGRYLAIEPVDRRVALWSTDRREIVAGPVDSFGLRTVSELDGSLVALDLDGRIAVFDDDGVRVDARLVVPSTGDGTTVRTDLLGVAGSGSTAVVGSDTSIGFTFDGDDIVVRWERDGRASQLVDTDRGAASLLVWPDPTGVARVLIVDATDGETVAAPAPGRERLPILARNGYLLAPAARTPDDEAIDRVLAAFDLDDRSLWTLPIAPGADYDVLDGAVVVVERTLDGSVLTVAR